MATQIYRIGMLTLRARRELVGPHGAVAIGGRALDLLSTLAEAGGALVTKDDLFSAIWTNSIVEENAVQAQVSAARKALGNEARRLVTVHGRGYRLDLDASEAAPAVEADQASSAVLASAGAGQTAGLAQDKHGDMPWLAVLPFTNRSSLPEDDVFAIGMVEDLINALSQGVHLRVLASSVTARFRNDLAPDFETMARELGVRYVLEGYVRRTGSDLRVTAQLVEAASGTILWTQKFERPLSEFAALQEDLVLDVAAHLDVQVYRMEMARTLRKPANLTAWECVTRATAAYRQITPGSLVQAITEAQRAVELSPDYALAHAMLAHAKATLFFWTSPDSDEEVRAVRVHIDCAMALEPESAMVLYHVAEAFNYIGQPQEAIRAAKLAIQLRPNFGLAHYVCAVACVLLDRIDDALGYFDAELTAAPGSHTLYASYVWRGAAHVRAGDWDAAACAYNRSTQINPAAAVGYLGEAFVAAQLQRAEEARGLMAKVRQLGPEMPVANWKRIMCRGLVNNPLLDTVIRHIDSLWVQTEAVS